MQVGLLRPLTSQFGNAGHRLTLLLTLLDLTEHHLGDIRMLMQVVIHLCLDEVAYILIHGNTTRAHRLRTKFDLRLTLKHRFLHIHGNGSHQSVTDISVFQVLIEILLDGAGDMLLESRLVSTALRGMLTVHKRVILLTILIGMCEGNLYILSLHVDDWVDAIHGHIVIQQVLQTITAEDASAVVHNDQSGIQVGIVTEHGLHEVIMEGVVLKERVIGLKEHKSTGFIGCSSRRITLQFSPLKGCGSHLSVTEALHLKTGAQRIDSLQTHAVQSDTLLESLRVVLTTGIQHAHSLDEFSLRDTTTIIAHRHPQVILDIYLDALAGIHLKLIDRVVDHLFQQYIDTIFWH